jgi:hypothetical protein
VIFENMAQQLTQKAKENLKRNAELRQQVHKITAKRKTSARIQS